MKRGLIAGLIFFCTTADAIALFRKAVPAPINLWLQKYNSAVNSPFWTRRNIGDKTAIERLKQIDVQALLIAEANRFLYMDNGYAGPRLRSFEQVTQLKPEFQIDILYLLPYEQTLPRFLSGSPLIRVYEGDFNKPEQLRLYGYIADLLSIRMTGPEQLSFSSTQIFVPDPPENTDPIVATVTHALEMLNRQVFSEMLNDGRYGHLEENIQVAIDSICESALEDLRN